MKNSAHKYIIILLFICLTLFTTGCSSSAASEPPQPSETPFKYVDNEALNDFIIKYNKVSESAFSDVRAGRSYNCYAFSYGYYIELRDLNNSFEALINQTNDTAESGVSGMKTVVYDVIRVLDDTISFDDYNQLFDKVIEGYASENEIGNLNITFYPDTDHSRGHFTVARNK